MKKSGLFLKVDKWITSHSLKIVKSTESFISSLNSIVAKSKGKRE